ncbi:MAG TPA: TIM barrel protein [Bryobacteraceae bacterium]|nr:TIM barrel protein [Bryobacteraceae bacterium]
MTRRSFLAASAALTAAGATPPRSQMGVAETALHPAKDTIAFLDWAWSLGAGGIQAHLTSFDADYLKRLRETAEQRGMYIEVMGDLQHIDHIAPAASATGARAIRVVAPGARRYEAFATLDEWRTAEAAARKQIAAAIPIAAQSRVPIAIENHRDRTLEELVALMREFAGDWFGVNLDTGNNIALLDDPMEVVEQLAPYAFAAHIKDMGVEEYKDGFLIDEVAFGSGVVDLPRACKLITRARLTMEMLTRDPTPVACLTDHYWQVLPDRKASGLARTIRAARTSGAKLPRVTGLDKAAQAAIEEETIRYNLFKSRQFPG